jgi:hypothetical protein
MIWRFAAELIPPIICDRVLREVRARRCDDEDRENANRSPDITIGDQTNSEV